MQIDTVWALTRDMSDREFEQAVINARAARHAAAQARAYTRALDAATYGIATREALDTPADQLTRALARAGLNGAEIADHFAKLG